MQTYLIFKYRPPGPPAGLPEQDMPTIYSRKANLGEIPDVGEIVSLPTEELELPSSNIKEQQGEQEMSFKVVDRGYDTYAEVTEGGYSTRHIAFIVTNFDAYQLEELPWHLFTQIARRSVLGDWACGTRDSRKLK